MEGQPFLLQFAVWACVIIFFVGFFTALYANLLVISKTGGVINRTEDQGLDWGERHGRKFSRFSRFFVDDDFRPLRRFSFGAWTSTAVSFGLFYR